MLKATKYGEADCVLSVWSDEVRPHKEFGQVAHAISVLPTCRTRPHVRHLLFQGAINKIFEMTSAPGGKV